SRSPTSRARGSSRVPAGAAGSSAAIASWRASAERETSTTVPTPVSSRSRRRAVSSPMPREAPVIRAVRDRRPTVEAWTWCSDIALLLPQQELRQAHVGGGGDLEVPIGAGQDVHRMAGVGDEGRVLRPLLAAL